MGLVVQNGCWREWCESGAVSVDAGELVVAVEELSVRRQLLESSQLNRIDRLFFDVRFGWWGIVGVAWKKGKFEKLLKIMETEPNGKTATRSREFFSQKLVH